MSTHGCASHRAAWLISGAPLNEDLGASSTARVDPHGGVGVTMKRPAAQRILGRPAAARPRGEGSSRWRDRGRRQGGAPGALAGRAGQRRGGSLYRHRREEGHAHYRPQPACGAVGPGRQGARALADRRMRRGRRATALRRRADRPRRVSLRAGGSSGAASRSARPSANCATIWICALPSSGPRAGRHACVQARNHQVVPHPGRPVPGRAELTPRR